MSRLRTPAVSLALKMRSEGMGIRASGRVLEKSHVSIIGREQKLVTQSQQWFPPAPVGADIADITYIPQVDSIFSIYMLYEND
jgi:hypothetical protein